MIIGMDGSRAFLKQRTGVEEYSYQVIKHLVNKLDNHEVVLYLRKNQAVDFKLPENWKIKKLWLPYFSSQLRFSLEFLINPVDILFIMAHTVPPIHPKNTIVVIHGLEYEFVPDAFSWWERFYMRVVIKNACRWAKKIIAVSNNTKNDLVRLYGISKDKIQVIYEGYDRNFEFRISNFESNSNFKNSNLKIGSKFKIQNSKFLLFIGRLEERKNIIGIIKSFEILKEQYKIPHKLVLAGRFGYGAKKIEASIEDSNFRKYIILPGYVAEDEKWELLKNADVFLFPTFYEGFGLPILEAQSAGVPVVAGNNSSIPEVVNYSIEAKPRLRSRGFASDYSAILVDPRNAEQIADATHKLISDKALRDDIIKKGYENVKRFSWEKCAEEIAQILKNDAK